MFLLSTGKAGKFFINELTKLFNAWIDDSPLTKLVMKAVMIMPSLLLQKPSKESQSKDHLKALQWRIELWQSSHPLGLLQDSLTIQRNLKSAKAWKTVAKTSKNFVEEMQKENVNGPLKLLTVNIDHRTLPLNHDTISKLEMKHLQASAPDSIILLPDEAQNIHPISIKTSQLKMYIKLRLIPRELMILDADGWCRILASSSFGDSSADLSRAIASFTRKLFSEKLNTSSLEAFLVYWLILLDKNQGLRPAGIGKILRRIARKVAVSFTHNDIIDSVGSLQVCAGHEAGWKALIHAMNNIFQDEQTEVVLLVDAVNAFNAVNYKAFLHNINIIRPLIATFVHNCYFRPSRLFVIGGVEIVSSEGTIQSDHVAMAVYAISIIP